MSQPTIPPKKPSIHTIKANLQAYEKLDWDNTTDITAAQTGLNKDTIPTAYLPAPLKIWKNGITDAQKANGYPPCWTLANYEQFVNPEWNPETIPVNPSLWRIANINNNYGLFTVCPGVYQVRGYDLSNMTIVETPGDTTNKVAVYHKPGLLVIDPLISCECAAAALALYQQNQDPQKTRRVNTVIYTHSHVDHFGGVGGILPGYDPNKPYDCAANNVEIYAPEGFLEHAASENVYAGVAMSRRAQYMYGPFLTQGLHGQVDAGLGKNQSTGTVSLVAPTSTPTPDPTDPTAETVFQQTQDGEQIIFQPTPGTEAPSEFNFLLINQNAMCLAENATHNLHNILTLRGALVRDALAWSKYLQRTIALFFDQNPAPPNAPKGPPCVIFAQHHWPTFPDPNNPDCMREFLANQRDMYRYLNDQTLRLINKGFTGIQIAEMFEFPPDINRQWYCRGYYGSVSHNVKAVYQRYMGWFDGNPSNLHSLPQEEAAIKYFSYMGGLESILPKAVSDYEEGQYRWVSEVLKHVVALPLSYQARLDQTRLTEARNLLADSLEQQGYQAEAATWRNFFLMGAQELRGPIKKIQATGSAFLDALETEMCFDALAVQISPEKFFKAQKKSKTKPFSVVLRWNFTYTSSQNKPEFVQVSVENAALNYLQYTTVQSTWGTPTTPYITVPRDDFNALLTNIAAAASNNTNPQNIISDFFSNKDTQITPPASLQDVQSTLTCFFGLLGKSDPSFPIVTPQRPHAATD